MNSKIDKKITWDNNCKIELKCHSQQYIKIIIIVIISYHHTSLCTVITEKLTRLLVVG